MRFTLSTLVTLALATGIAVAADASPSAAKDAFDKAGIPGDIDLKNFNPAAVLDVSFPGPPQPGQQLPPPPIPLDHGGEQLSENNTSNPPEFSLRAPGKPVNIGKGPFVIAVVDLDAPNAEKPDNSAPVRHFLGGGFTFKDDGVSLVNNTPAVTEYEPPSPPDNGSKPHRVVFLLYEQPKGFMEQKEVTPDTGRDAFNVSQFAEKVGLGEPVAGTYTLVGPPN